MAVPLAVALGVISGLSEGSWLDNAINVASLSVVALPEFVTGLILIELFAFQLHWLPSSSSIDTGAAFPDVLPSLLLPALIASFGFALSNLAADLLYAYLNPRIRLD